MLLHDVCDVPMEAAKLFRYANDGCRSSLLNAASEAVFFGFFAVRPFAWVGSPCVHGLGVLVSPSRAAGQAVSQCS